MGNKERWFKVVSVDKHWDNYTPELEEYVGKILQLNYFDGHSGVCLFVDDSEDYWWFEEKGLEEIKDFLESEEHGAVAEGSKAQVDKALGVDRGKHYRHSFRLNLTEQDKENGFVMVNIDPYRISEVYSLGGWREHILKKTLRGTDKGHTASELLEELQCCLDRANQMYEESKE